MPIYEFICQECDAQFETILSSAAGRDSVTCKRCGGKRIKKLLSTASFLRSSVNGNASISSNGGGCSPRSGFS